ILRCEVHEHPNPPYALALLRARRERPGGCRAAERGYQFPPSDRDWHVNPPREGCLRRISRRDHAVLPRVGEGVQLWDLTAAGRAVIAFLRACGSSATHPKGVLKL